MRYSALTRSGHEIIFRNVLEFRYDAPTQHLVMQVPGQKFEVHGCISLSAGGDFEPWGSSIDILPPNDGGAPLVAGYTGGEVPVKVDDADGSVTWPGFDRRELPAPQELKPAYTFNRLLSEIFAPRLVPASTAIAKLEGVH